MLETKSSDQSAPAAKQVEVITISVNASLAKELDDVCELLGMEKNVFIERAINHAIAIHRSVLTNGRKAIVYRDADGEIDSYPCTVVADTTLYGKPYYQIVVDGHVSSIPREFVKFEKH